jgi:hypothetical protein
VILSSASSHLLAASTAPPADRTTALIKATSEQFQIAYRMHPGQGRERQEQLTAVVAAWHAAARNDTNNELLTTWLRSAIRSSMPGSREALPQAPLFVHDEPVAKATKPATKEVRSAPAAASEPTPTIATLPKSIDQMLADPFRDDPDQE